MAAAPALPPPVQAAIVAPVAAPARDAATTHTVRSGETLSAIAARHGTTVRALAAANDLADPDRIHAGSRLRVPGSDEDRTRASRPSAHVHVVRPGDTLSGIAARYGVPLAGLLKANRLATTSVIHPGDRVTVRGGARAASTTKASARTRSSASSSSVPDTFLGVRYPTSVAREAARNRDRLASRDVPSRTEVRVLVERTARRHGVDPRLALAVAYQESGWNQRAVSPANAIGVMQVIPAGGEWAGMLLGRDLDLLDTEDNVTAGVVMLRALGRETGDRRSTLAAYYQGLTSLRQHGAYTDTRRYVDTVLALRERM